MVLSNPFFFCTKNHFLAWIVLSLHDLFATLLPFSDMNIVRRQFISAASEVTSAFVMYIVMDYEFLLGPLKK